MNCKTSLIAALLLTACAAPRTVERTPPVPPPAPGAAATTPRLVQAVDEEASRAWLDRAIEQAPVVEPPAPMVQVVEVERVVERPVVVREPWDPYWRHYDYGGYRYPRYGRGVYRPGFRFPVNTAIGAGVGAIIGHQSGHRGRGAWIGGSIGYLFDIARH